MNRLIQTFFTVFVTWAVLAPPAAANMSHWFYQAKVDIGKDRAYDVDPQGVPLPDKRQGRSRVKMFGVLDVNPVSVCIPRGGWAEPLFLATKAKDQRLEFYVSGCNKTIIRVHFNRPIETADYAPEPIARYVSGLFEVHGFGLEGLTGALGAAMTEVAADETKIRVGPLEAPFGEDYLAQVTRYGGGLSMRSVEAKDGGKRSLWTTLVMSRPMSQQEAALGPAALLEHFRSQESRWLSATYGKKLKKKLDMPAASVNGLPHLSVQHTTGVYRRRDYLFDQSTARVHYLESFAGRGKKDREALDAAVQRLIASSRVDTAPQPGGALSSLTAIPEGDLAELETSEAVAFAGLDGQTFDPSIEIVSVAVQPAEVRPGDELRLIVQYEVGGIPPGASFMVEERRELILDEVVLTAVEDSAGRTAGSHTSTKVITAPPGAKPGVYTLTVSVSLAGVEAESSALFRVQ